MTDLHARLRDDLTTAMRERDRGTVRVLRTVLSALANAEAQPVDGSAPTTHVASGPIAGAATGLGATEAARRELDEHEVRAIVETERDERIAAADDLAARGAAAAAVELMSEVTVLDRYLRS
jgi:uncharacterized protein YqeY